MHWFCFQFQLQGDCVSKCWAQANSLFPGRSPKETLTAICSSTTVFQVGSFSNTHTLEEHVDGRIQLCNVFSWGGEGLSERHSNLVLISFNLKDLRKRLLGAVEVSQSFLQLCQVRDKVFPGVCQQIWKCRADRKQRWQDLQHDRVQSGTGESKGILSSCSFSI